MIVSEGKTGEIAVKIKHHISINIYKEVTSALLCINESVNLVALVDIV